MGEYQQWRANMLQQIGKYWDAAYAEGCATVNNAEEANRILHGVGGLEELMSAHLQELQLYRALCEGYTLEELQRMSLTFKAQIDVLRARPTVPPGHVAAPAVATDRMTWVGQSMRYDREISIGSIYAAMLAAAQEVSHDAAQ